MRAVLFALAIACTCGDPPGPRESRRKLESRADERYPAPPSFADGPIDLHVARHEDDGTVVDGVFKGGGVGEKSNRAKGSDWILLRFDRPADLAAPVHARLHLPVIPGGRGRTSLRIVGLHDDGGPPADLARTGASVTWNLPRPWPDPYEGMPDREDRTGLHCAPFERATPDVAPIVAELLARPGAPLVFAIEAEKGELRVQDSGEVEGEECPGRLAPRLELFPTLRSTLLGKELAGRPTDRSATVSLFPLLDLELAVDFGTGPDDRRSTPVKRREGGEPVLLDLEGLAADTRYEWSLRYRKPGTEAFEVGPTHVLRTQRAPGQPFTFTVTADGHFINMEHRRAFSSMHLLKATMDRVARDAPDFHIDLGDSLNGESYRSYDAPDREETLRRFLAVRPYFELADAPVFLVVGNHEGEQGWRIANGDALAMRATRARKSLFPNPQPGEFYGGNTRREPNVGLPEDYFSWRWGDVLFVVIDPYRYTEKKPHRLDGGEGTNDRWDWTLGKDQYDWLVRTLEESDAPFKLVLSHQVTGGTNTYGRGGRMAAVAAPGNGCRAGEGSYEWGGHGPSGADVFEQKRPGWGRPIHRVLADTGVTAFVHGHDHVFAFEPPLDGVTYVTVPQPGDAAYDLGHAPRTGLHPDATVLANSGHVRFTASPGALKLEYVRSFLPGDGTDGEVAFTHVFTP